MKETAVLDHIGLSVSDFGPSRAFYLKALEPLGMGVVMEGLAVGGGAGFGPPGKPLLWISQGAPTTGLHLAFAAGKRAQVDAFYVAAMAAGGRDNGGPGLRPHYHPNYYAAFVRDPDGNNIEVVCHLPE